MNQYLEQYNISAVLLISLLKDLDKFNSYYHALKATRGKLECNLEKPKMDADSAKMNKELRMLEDSLNSKQESVRSKKDSKGFFSTRTIKTYK
jgi:hypothetical protein